MGPVVRRRADCATAAPSPRACTADFGPTSFDCYFLEMGFYHERKCIWNSEDGPRDNRGKYNEQTPTDVRLTTTPKCPAMMYMYPLPDLGIRTSA